MFSEIIVPKNKNIELTPVCPRNFLYRKKKKKTPKSCRTQLTLSRAKLSKAKETLFPIAKRAKDYP